MQHSLRTCLFLLPGYELEGFPRSLPPEQAAELLAGWVGLWHPRLLHALQSIPSWQQANSFPSEATGALVVVPEIAKSEMDSEFEKAHHSGDLALMDPSPDWRQNQTAYLEAVGLGSVASPDTASPTPESLTENLREDFAALGYAYLQIQLMTRQMRYSSNLDQLLFSEQVAAAAEAAVGGDSEKAEEMLQSCFDSLGQERDHYYSLDVNLLDITLLAESTLGTSLARQLEQTAETSFLAAASLLRVLRDKQPENFQRLQDCVRSEAACIVGGLDIERPHPLLTRDAFARDLYRGRDAYRELGFDPPSVFSRLSFGLSADNSADLRRFGFEGVFLTAWAAGSYPEGSQAKFSWEASDGTFLSALGSEVLDASNPASYLSLGWAAGEALDRQHVPTMIFAHWPGRACEFHTLLQIVARRTPALGKWTTATKYFAETDQPYHQERLNAGAFRYNWLVESDAPNATLLATEFFHQLQARSRSIRNLSNLAWQLENHRTSQLLAEDSNNSADAMSGEPSSSGTAVESSAEIIVSPLAVSKWEANLERLDQLADSLLDTPADAAQLFADASNLANSLSDSIMRRLSALLIGKPSKKEENPRTVGRLVVNPRNCPLRIRVQSDVDTLYAPESWNFASGRAGHERYTCIDVPSMGFVVAPFDIRPASSTPRQIPLAEAGGMLQSEFLEAQIDSRRGHLRSLHVPARRGNRLSLMIARRDRGQDGKFVYSEMIATNVRMLTSSNICGLIRASGRMEIDGKPTAEFEIDYEVWRGSRILEIVIRLSKMSELSDSNPWRSAYVARLAWPSESALVRSYACGRRMAWSSGRAISPSLIEIDETDYRTHFLTGGLAFHRRTEMRFLETILSANSNDVEHRIGIGVDLPYPMQAATDFVDHRYSIPIARTGQLKPSHGWLVSNDVKNVIVDVESPLVDAHGKLVGMRLFLVECEGKSTNTKVRLMNEVASAGRVDYLGNMVGRLTAKEDSFTIALRANEQCNVDVIWK